VPLPARRGLWQDYETLSRSKFISLNYYSNYLKTQLALNPTSGASTLIEADQLYAKQRAENSLPNLSITLLPYHAIEYPLPPEWTPQMDIVSGKQYFLNVRTGKKTDNHPLVTQLRNNVKYVWSNFFFFFCCCFLIVIFSCLLVRVKISKIREKERETVELLYLFENAVKRDEKIIKKRWFFF
jgi:hypothetical protein